MLLESITSEQRTVLYNVSWDTFEALLRDTGEGRGSRFAYDCGTLEIMTPLFEHENPKIQFEVLEKATHIFPLEYPKEVFEKIRMDIS